MDAPGLSGQDLAGLVSAEVRRLFPELAAGRLVARLARVVAVESGAGVATGLEPRLSVSVQPLTADGTDDPSWPMITGVRVAVLASGDGQGLTWLPATGAIVRLSWLYGSAALPIVDPYTAEGFAVPALSGAMVLRHGGAKIRIGADGSVEVTPAPGRTIMLGGELALLTDVFLGHTHPAPGGPTGAALAPAGSTTTTVRAG